MYIYISSSMLLFYVQHVNSVSFNNYHILYKINTQNLFFYVKIQMSIILIILKHAKSMMLHLYTFYIHSFVIL